MRKQQLSDIVWREVRWQRPYKLETVWEVLSHLASTVPRGAVVWEARGKSGQVTYLLGTSQMYTGKIQSVFHAHGDIQFREVSGNTRQSVTMARVLKISHPSLSLNIDIAASMIRAGLAHHPRRGAVDLSPHPNAHPDQAILRAESIFFGAHFGRD